jgi:hypothetical protein
VIAKKKDGRGKLRIFIFRKKKKLKGKEIVKFSLHLVQEGENEIK